MTEIKKTETKQMGKRSDKENSFNSTSAIQRKQSYNLQCILLRKKVD